MNDFLRGTGVALATPFFNDGTIDFDGLTSLVNSCIDGKVDYLVVLGTTGETATLSVEEKKQIVAHVISVNKERVPIVIGIGGYNTASLVNQIKDLDTSGLSAILSVAPMYSKPSQEGIYQHFKALSEASKLPILLYNVPARTVIEISVATVVRLAKLDNIIGIKDATGDIAKILNLIKDTPDDFLVISGEDNLALPTIIAGGAGVISVVAQAFPVLFCEMMQLGFAGENKKAFDILYKLLPAFEAIFAEGNPVGIKQTLAHIGICSNHVRLPLVSVTPKLADKIKNKISDLKQLQS